MNPMTMVKQWMGAASLLIAMLLFTPAAFAQKLDLDIVNGNASALPKTSTITE